MLVVSRHQHESIVLSGGVRITILKISPGQVRIGFEAPPEVSIVREELIPDSDVLASRPPDARRVDGPFGQYRRPAPELERRRQQREGGR